MKRIAVLVGLFGLLPLVFAMHIVQQKDRLLFWGTDKVQVASSLNTKLALENLLASKSLYNIVRVSRADDTLSLVALGREDSGSDGLSLFLLHLPSRDLKRIQKIPGLTNATLSPHKNAVALTVCDANGCNLDILDLTTNRRVTAAKNELIASGSVSWDNNGERIAFDTRQGVIKVLSLLTNSEQSIIEGSSPSWSPDGSKIAFVKDKQLLLYEFQSKTKTSLYKRWFWQTAFFGEVYWRDDGSVIAFNVPAGLTGYEYECFAFDLQAKQTKLLYSGSYRCGPWI